MTLVYVNGYYQTKDYNKAKTANSLSTANLIITIICALPMGVMLLLLLVTSPEIIEDSASSYEEVVGVVMGMLFVAGIPVALTIFGFVTSAKGRKLWKNVNTVGNPNYVPLSQRPLNYANTTNSRTTFVNASGQDIRYGHQQNNTAYNNNTYNTGTAQVPYTNPQAQNVTTNNIPGYQQTATYNTATTVKTSSVTQNPQAACNYGRSETGYIPHPESTDTHCATHNSESTGSKWKCSSCGKRNRAEETFCRNCGTNRTAVY